jgi:hypothetical protein
MLKLQAREDQAGSHGAALVAKSNAAVAAAGEGTWSRKYCDL